MTLAVSSLAGRIPLCIAVLIAALSLDACAPKFNFTPGSISSSNLNSSAPAVASQVVFTREPSSETASGSEIPVQITIEDENGHVVTSGPDASAQISLTLTSGSGPLNGTITVSAENGVADFVYKGVNIATLGSGDVITATKADMTSSGGAGPLTSTSDSFDVTSNNSWYGAKAMAKWLTTGGQPAAGNGDGMFDAPTSAFVDSSGNVYVIDTGEVNTDSGNFRVMKFNSSGAYQGWIGMVGATPTGGASGCTSTSNGSITPGWCTGGYGSIYLTFSQIWGDGTYLYVTAGNFYESFAIFRFNASTGAYMGWTGQFTGNAGDLSDTYTAGCSTLNGSVTPKVTPGWCVGDETWGIGYDGLVNGTFNFSVGITGDGTYLYVANEGSRDIQRVTASSGAAAGWIGNLGKKGGGGCGSTTGSFVGAWCTDATAQPQASGKADGSFANGPYGVSYDSGTASLYVADNGNDKINRYTASSGAFTGWTGMVGTQPTGGDAGCTSTNPDNPTPGWCTGGAAEEADSIDGLNLPLAITGDGTYLYVLDADPRIVRYKISNGAYEGWIGAIGDAGGGSCGSVGTFTGGWCSLSGTEAEAGSGDGMLGQLSADEDSTNDYSLGLFADGSGNLWVADVANNRVSEYAASSAVFEGWSGAESSATVGWQTSNTITAGANDDNSFDYALAGVFTDGTNLFVADDSRIKNYSLSTLTYNGWIGTVLQTPTGGTSGCTSTASGSVTPGWCTGGYSEAGFDSGYPVGSEPEGGLDNAGWMKITADGNYIYAVYARTQVNRYDESTGAFAGWIGVVGSTPTGGDAGCTSTSVGSPTPGWCTGGSSESSAASGGFDSASEIYSDGTYLYVADGGQWGWGGNSRVDKVVASTGQFVGWIGAIETSPTGGVSGCSGATGDTPGWCTGGSASGISDTTGGVGSPISITGDGTYIYVGDGNQFGAPYGDGFGETVDRYVASSGAFAGWIGAIGTAGGTCTGGANQFNGGWCSGGTPTNGHWGASGLDEIGAVDMPNGIYTDGLYLYVSDGGEGLLSKYILGTGAFVGWKGQISGSPTGGDTGCNGAVVGTFTPGWCTGGIANPEGYDTTGAFISGPLQISGTGSFLYVVDQGNFRIDRIGK